MSLRERRVAKKLRRDAPRKKGKGGTSSSDSEGEEEHELFHYAGDRVQLMKEVLKILKSKKIKSLAPDSIKGLDIEEINTMLFEELLGISNKRLKKILDGQNADDESSSTSEDGETTEKQIDIISLDDVSDDDLCLIEDGPSEKNKKDPKNDKTKNSKKHRIKKEPKEKKIKEEPVTEKEKLLSVLELLELQARARAIRSQIALETDTRSKESVPAPREEESDEDAVVVEIIQPPKEIIISSSDSETETNNKKKQTNEINSNTGEVSSANDKTAKTLSTTYSNRINKSVSKPDSEKSNNSDSKTPVVEISNFDITAKESKAILIEETISEIPLPSKEAVASATKNENGESSKGGNDSFRDSGNKTDSEDDVIRLDIVEIEGIDD